MLLGVNFGPRVYDLCRVLGANRLGRGGALVEADGARSLLKLSPLFDQTRDAVNAFARLTGVPVNPLHARGFLSIGCAPCTRAVRPGEPERAGRWWWEDDTRKECGLHHATGATPGGSAV